MRTDHALSPALATLWQLAKAPESLHLPLNLSPALAPSDSYSPFFVATPLPQPTNAPYRPLSPHPCYLLTAPFNTLKSHPS